MLALKEYQTRTLETLRLYFSTCQRLGDADTAFYNLTKQVYGTGIAYREVKELPGLPYEQCLLEDFAIPAEQIRRATGTDRGIDGLDLSDPSCAVRFIITVQALREGWDCPFAYVLCSVAEMRSSTAVEQILGRIMRLPKAQRKQYEELNMS